MHLLLFNRNRLHWTFRLQIRFACFILVNKDRQLVVYSRTYLELGTISLLAKTRKRKTGKRYERFRSLNDMKTALKKSCKRTISFIQS